LKGIHGVCCISNILFFVGFDHDIEHQTKRHRRGNWEGFSRKRESTIVWLTVYSTKATGAPPLLCIRSRQNPGKLLCFRAHCGNISSMYQTRVTSWEDRIWRWIPSIFRQ
jgi:hypothetical protein